MHRVKAFFSTTAQLNNVSKCLIFNKVKAVGFLPGMRLRFKTRRKRGRCAWFSIKLLETY